ncbi:nucleotidyltransferase family protein [Fusobacterium perfoetens]|uniref:nucleotidyltransferase family protein n=1 Tax=Fusobacterium perfoetens TaxID=852 RepID=UPI00048626F8|nr:nucleotidyltransferase family protein [Fusobacterium perfoetens]
MKLDIILLAAGNSKRFGSNKLLYKLNNKYMFEYTLENIFSLKKIFKESIENIIVVSKYKEIEEYLKTTKINNIKYKENPHSEMGISSSIILGLNEINNKNFLMFMVCDQPYLKVETLEKFIKNFFKQSKKIGCLFDGKDLGNPCIFSPEYIEELKNIKGDKGGKQIIKKHMEEVFSFMVEDKKELEDIDFLK